MKRPLKIVVIGCCLLLVLASCNYALAECKTKCCEDEYPKLVVQGEGKIEILADKATFKINVRVEEKKLERAFALSTEKINSISETLTSSGVKKEDIRNVGYIYHPLYEGKRIFSTIARPTSYEVVYTLKITVYNMDTLGKILAKLSEVSETTVYDLEYTSTKIEELRREALKKAGVDARQKAMKLAEGTGAVLGKAIRIQTGIQEYRARDLKMSDVDESRMMVSKEESFKVSPQIESGYLEIIGNCTVYYSIQ